MSELTSDTSCSASDSSNTMPISTALPSSGSASPWYRRCRPSVVSMRDPVCGKTIHPNRISQVREGTTFYFCSTHCRRKFMPAAFLERTYRITWDT